MTAKEGPSPDLSDKPDVLIIPPDRSLKKLIGEDVDIHQIFSKERVEKAQNVINEHKTQFAEWVRNDLKTLADCHRNAAARPADCHSDIQLLGRTAFVIKSQAGTFGFPLATQIAKSLTDFCRDHPLPNVEQLLVMRKHIDALMAVFQNQIMGDGGAIGAELTDGLLKLVDKFKVK